MRTSALTSSPLVSPISGFSTAPALWPCAQQRLQAVDQGVLVGAVQRVAGLEGDDALPALLGAAACGLRAA